MRHARPEWGDMRPTRLLERLAPLPRLRDALMARGHALAESVDRRTLETVALRVAVVRDSAYEWVAHTSICMRNGFLTEQEIARIAGGADWLTGADAATVQAVDDLLHLGRLGGATRVAVGDRALDIQAVTIFYDVLADVAAGLEPEQSPVPRLETHQLATAILKPGDHA